MTAVEVAAVHADYVSNLVRHCGEWRQISAAIETALRDLAPARPIPARKNLDAADVSGIAYPVGESA